MNKIIFILGSGRNGSTLLDMVLNSHSEIFSVGEMDHLEGDIQREKGSYCGCGIPLKSCPFWNKIWNKIKYQYSISENEFYTHPNSEIHKYKRKVQSVYDLLFSVINIYPNRSHKKFSKRFKEEIYEEIFLEKKVSLVSDSMKDVKRAIRISNYLKRKYEFKFIHLVRDGRAVVNSYMKNEEIYYIKNENNELVKQTVKLTNTTNTVLDYINAWKKVNQRILNYAKTFRSKDYYLIRYEDFTENPEKELKKLCIFLDIPFEPEMLKLDRFENHIIRGNPSAKFKAKIIKSASKTITNNLNSNDLKLFYSKAGKLNKKFKYSSKL